MAALGLEAKARHRKVMRALKEEAFDQNIVLKKKYKHLIEDNVQSGLYSMQYILDHKLYLPEPPALMDAELRAAGKIKTIGNETEVFDVRDMRAHLSRNVEKMQKLKDAAGDHLQDDDVLLYNSLKAGEKIRMVDETPLYDPASKPKFTRFDKGARPEEHHLGPFVAKIHARADELLQLQPPMRSTYRLEPEIDEELNARKEEKKQLMKKSEEITQRHLYTAEIAAITLKAEDILGRPHYMPREIRKVPPNPFSQAMASKAPKGTKERIIYDEEIEDLLNKAEEKISYRFNAKDIHKKPKTILVMGGNEENTEFNWYTERLNNKFSAEEKKLTRIQRKVRASHRNVQDSVGDFKDKTSILSLANGLAYQKDDKVHPDGMGNVAKQLEAVDARERVVQEADWSRKTLKSAFMDQPMWKEDKAKRDKAAFYEAGLIPGQPKLQEKATAADKVVDDFLKGIDKERVRV